MAHPNPAEVTISLTSDEALVLFDFLQRYSDTDKLSLEDQSEQRALWNLACIIEQALAEPFQQDFAARLQAARIRLRDES